MPRAFLLTSYPGWPTNALTAFVDAEVLSLKELSPRPPTQGVQRASETRTGLGIPAPPGLSRDHRDSLSLRPDRFFLGILKRGLLHAPPQES